HRALLQCSTPPLGARLPQPCAVRGEDGGCVATRSVRKSGGSPDFLQSFFPHPIAKPWDYVFSQRKRYWVLATLKDGRQVAGRYDAKSFSSSAPAPEQLYLEEAWVLNSDGGFERPRAESAGILVLTSEIATVELFNVTHGGEHVAE